MEDIIEHNIEKLEELLLENIEQNNEKLKGLLLAGMTKLNNKIEEIKAQIDVLSNPVQRLDLGNAPIIKNSSDEIDKLAMSLVKAQSEIEIAGKSSNAYNFKYADLAEIVRVSRPALTKNELAVLQPITNYGNIRILETMLLHSSGQWIKSFIYIPEISVQGKTPIQSMGATITYLRRYAYASLVGVVTSKEEDLDKE